MLYQLHGIDLILEKYITILISVVNSVDHFQMSCGSWKNPMLCPGSYLWSCNQVSSYYLSYARRVPFAIIFSLA